MCKERRKRKRPATFVLTSRPVPAEEKHRLSIQKVAVIGTGLMGRGIAYAAAAGGLNVSLHDVSGEALNRALVQIRRDMDEAVARGKMSSGEVEAALGRLQPDQELDSDADFVIEAIPEDISLKLRIFARLDRICREDVVIATNTSGLSITEIAAATRRPGRVAGMHFFNPVPKMKLVEIVRGLETTDATLATVAEVAARMGKDTVTVKEFPGFITSRVNALIGNEAFLMLQEGVASARDIDKALKLGLNHPMGPFELVDLVGLDTRLSVLEFLHRSLGDKYKPATLLVQYVKAGRLGRKAGRGVYDYTEDK
jgi:3-hydroxybutyryl-CoA dehydrogenase